MAWFTLEALETTLARTKIEGSIAKTVARICRADLIVIDDVGLLPVAADTRPRRSTRPSKPHMNVTPSR